jgi:hypothetical protein
MCLGWSGTAGVSLAFNLSLAVAASLGLAVACLAVRLFVHLGAGYAEKADGCESKGEKTGHSECEWLGILIPYERV